MVKLLQKNGKTYFYYYCNDCKVQFKENVINDVKQVLNQLELNIMPNKIVMTEKLKIILKKYVILKMI